MESESLIDRQARDVLAECVRLYLEFDVPPEEMYDVANEYSSSSDLAVRDLSRAFVFHIFEDGFGCDAVALPKATWDAIQRYLLLLDSDFQIEDSYSYIWTYWQVAALAGVLLFFVAAQFLGAAAAFSWLSLPSAALSIWISKKKSEKRPVSPFREQLEPFDSFQSLKSALQQVRQQHGFEKIKFPGKVLKPVWGARRFSIVSHFLFLVMLPTVLFLPFQALPIQHVDRRCIAFE